MSAIHLFSSGAGSYRGLKATLKVCISQRVEFIEDRKEIRDGLDQRVADWVSECGFIPVPIPNCLADPSKLLNSQPRLDEWLAAVGVDAILLSGGNDVGQCQSRDTTENYIIEWAKRNKKPILGICHGMQQMAHHEGVGMIPVSNHAGENHNLVVRSCDEIGLPEVVNSYHNFAIEVCPPGYRIIATSPDGVIEAIRNDEDNLEGWMWHPERVSQYREIDLNRFKRLVSRNE